MKENEVFFSIVIPVYNREELVIPTIESVINQSFKDYEVLVIDDGSTDNSAEVVDGYTIHPNFRLIKTKNQERGAARNTGINKALGKYIVFLDSDDYMHPNHLDVLHEYLLQTSDVNFVATKFDFIRDGKHSPNPALSHFSQQQFDYSFFLTGNHLACNFCIRKNNPNLQLFVEDRSYAIMEDWLFLIQNLVQNKIHIIDKVTITMNDHDDRSMRTNNAVIIERRLRANQWIHDQLSLEDIDRKVLDANTYYFCAIHYFIDKNYKKSREMLSKAIKKGGLKLKFIKLRLRLLLLI